MQCHQEVRSQHVEAQLSWGWAGWVRQDTQTWVHGRGDRHPTHIFQGTTASWQPWAPVRATAKYGHRCNRPNSCSQDFRVSTWLKTGETGMNSGAVWFGGSGVSRVGSSSPVGSKGGSRSSWFRSGVGFWGEEVLEPSSGGAPVLSSHGDLWYLLLLAVLMDYFVSYFFFFLTCFYSYLWLFWVEGP